LNKNYLNQIIEIARSPKILEPLSREMRDIIWKRVKGGGGVNSETAKKPSEQRLAPLSDNYKKWRAGEHIFFQKRNKQNQLYLVHLTRGEWNKIKPPRLGQYATASRSNLTLSGQMLDSITPSVTPQGTAQIVIPNTVRRPIYRNGGPPILNKTNLTNAELAEIQAKGGTWHNGSVNVTLPPRPFFALTSGEVNIITRSYELALRKEISRLFK
jgi:hypothetical protein